MKRENFKEEFNELKERVSVSLDEILTLNKGLRFISVDDIEGCDYGEMFEYRNEISGNVYDFHPVKILEDGQLKGITVEGEDIGGDAINMEQLSLSEQIRLLDLIYETK